MSLPRLRLERCTFDNGLWHIDAEEAHHLVRVRRCYTGSLVEGLLDGEKIELKLECAGDSVFAREISRVKEDAGLPKVELLLGLLKNDQLDDALRFCAETGVYAVRLLICERSVPRYEGAKLADKMARWRKILDEATKQASAATPPLLREPVPFSSADFGGLPPQRLAALLSPETKPLREIKIAPHTTVAIGPEGDWAPHESARLLAEGFIPVSLGRRIMRASTAVAAACAAAAILYEKAR
ncbi:RsmE family RNA methyltransferase [Cloacibacillus evryensis]|uniref:RsmE family RNA methyltransferase n=1 Tax=Cloacibacillus evryensis TaxID=508460 RepID=UPI0026E0CA29|nr:RsmE family RNA methyltransferase [Cloacibacillus evryensis]